MYFDDALKGFALRVSAKGVKTFVFQYRAGGAVRRLKLGRYCPDDKLAEGITPGAARKKAGEASAQVAAGVDPFAVRATEKAKAARAAESAREKAAAEAFTLADLVTEWETKSLATRSASHRKEAPAAIRRCFAKFLTRPVDSLKAAELQAVSEAIERMHPTMARRVRSYARAMANWAKARDKIAANPFDRVIIEAREVSRDRVLSDAELGAVWRASGVLNYPFGPLFRLLILTLQRRNEVAAMQWGELDAEFRTWTVPAGRAKNRKQHIVPLPLLARVILREVAEVPRAMGQVLVFTTTGKTPVSGFTWARDQIVRLVKQEAGEGSLAGAEPAAGQVAPDWHLHDFRRTGVTALARLGVAPHVADRMLNHVEGTIRGVAAVYQRHAFMAEREAAAELWAQHVLTVAGGAGRHAAPLPAKVLRAKRKPRKKRLG